MSEYQYHEFCRVNGPMPQAVRKIMNSFSSRAVIRTHGASYTYNYSDFEYDETEILLDYFDAYFYIANWAEVRLAFKFDLQSVDVQELRKYVVDNVIGIIETEKSVVVDIHLGHEHGFGCVEGEGILVDLLPLYEEIKAKNYSVLNLAKAINETVFIEDEKALEKYQAKNNLTDAQKVLLDTVMQGVTFEEE